MGFPLSYRLEYVTVMQCGLKIYEDCDGDICISEDSAVCGICGRGSELNAKGTSESAFCGLH